MNDSVENNPLITLFQGSHVSLSLVAYFPHRIYNTVILAGTLNYLVFIIELKQN